MLSQTGDYFTSICKLQRQSPRPNSTSMLMASKLPFLHISRTQPQSPELQHSTVCSRQNIQSTPRGSNSFPNHLSLSSSTWLSHSPNRSPNFLSPHWLHLHYQSPIATKPVTVTVRSQLNFPLISANDHWGTWTALFATTAFGIWSEKTKIGSALSGAIVGALIGLAASNLGLISCDAKA
ncbi:hypothetical protein REPUB_Repub07fG0139500 [Reevesia pubescens]